MFDDYETLEYNAIFCRYSSNIIKAVGQKNSWTLWTTLFVI